MLQQSRIIVRQEVGNQVYLQITYPLSGNGRMVRITNNSIRTENAHINNIRDILDSVNGDARYYIRSPSTNNPIRMDNMHRRNIRDIIDNISNL